MARRSALCRRIEAAIHELIQLIELTARVVIVTTGLVLLLLAAVAIVRYSMQDVWRAPLENVAPLPATIAAPMRLQQEPPHE